MGKILFFCFLLLASTCSFSQQTDASRHDVQEYLQKNERQKRIAFIMLGGGAIATIASIALLMSADDPSKSGGTPLFLVGASSMIGSIPKFIIASHNKNKAMALSGYLQLKQNEIGTVKLLAHRLPSLTVRLRF